MVGSKVIMIHYACARCKWFLHINKSEMVSKLMSNLDE